MKMSRILAVVSVAGLIATGCNGDDEAEPDAPADEAPADADTVTVETADNMFSPADLEVSAGEVEITLDNTGANPHTFTSEELDVDEDVSPGEQTTFTLSAEPGTYEFVCTIHEALGMVGSLTVTE